MIQVSARNKCGMWNGGWKGASSPPGPCEGARSISKCPTAAHCILISELHWVNVCDLCATPA